MRKLVTSRFFRCVVCLILVCCLVVSWSPIRAKAVVTEEAIGVAIYKAGLYAQAGAVSAGAAAFCWVLAGLIGVISVATAIDLMNQYVEYSNELEVSLYYYPDGSWSYGVDMGFVERVRAFLFDSGYLIYTGPASDFDVYDFPVGSGWPNALLYAINDGHSVVFFKENCGSFYRCYMLNSSDGIVSVSVSSDGRYKVTCSGGTMCYRCEPDYASTFDPRYVSDAYVPAENTVYWHVGGEVIIDNNISAADGVEIGVVAPLEVPMPEAYPEWHTNARPATNPDTQEEITVLPIPLDPNIQELPDTLTQPDIWQGTVADPYPDLDTNPDTGTDTDPDGGTSGDAPSTDIGDYQIDLKNFFPFCIPFDLYDFFTCLNADPVAPVIEWVIPLPGGGTYPLEIDLSAFDGVAQLLRRLQLLLFCVGLAFKTRDLIKG